MLAAAAIIDIGGCGAYSVGQCILLLWIVATENWDFVQCRMDQDEFVFFSHICKKKKKKEKWGKKGKVP